MLYDNASSSMAYAAGLLALPCSTILAVSTKLRRSGAAGVEYRSTRKREEFLDMAELRVPEEVLTALGDEPEREALEALLLHLIRADRVSVAWAGEKLGLDRREAIRWYTSHGLPFPDYAEEDLEEDAGYAERFGV